MDTVKYCGLALLGAFCGVLLRQLRPEYGTLLSLASCAILTTAGCACLAPLISYLKELESGRAGENIGILLKALGIGILTQMTAQVCRDAGEGAIASGIELLGKSEMLLLALPLLGEILGIVASLLQK